MTDELKAICDKYNLKACYDSGEDLPFRTVLQDIYYNWSKIELQNFMNDVMAMETEYGESIFD